MCAATADGLIQLSLALGVSSTLSCLIALIDSLISLASSSSPSPMAISDCRLTALLLLNPTLGLFVLLLAFTSCSGTGGGVPVGDGPGLVPNMSLCFSADFCTPHGYDEVSPARDRSLLTFPSGFLETPDCLAVDVDPSCFNVSSCSNVYYVSSTYRRAHRLSPPILSIQHRALAIPSIHKHGCKVTTETKPILQLQRRVRARVIAPRAVGQSA